MIPLRLFLSGFLSYRDPVEIDFAAFDLACIAGPNGAGKSSLLDAITWALFGEARRKDDAVINAQSKEANVSLDFSYEGNIYRVIRQKPREKTTLLEFQLREAGDDGVKFRTLSERTLRETQMKIEQVLRLDYETFINASFFLQGKADSFTQQRPGDRKRILGSILGLEQWEAYRQQAAERRKALEAEIVQIDGRLNEILAELAQEQARRENLARLEADLERQGRERQVQEGALESVRKLTAALEARRSLVETLQRQAEAAERNLRATRERLQVRQAERETYAALLARAQEIADGHQRWQDLRRELERWDEVAGRYHEQEGRRAAPRQEIENARAALEAEQRGLMARRSEMAAQEEERLRLQESMTALDGEVKAAEANLERREQLELELEAQRHAQNEAKVENKTLRMQMEDIKERMDKLQTVEGAICPTCGQPLDADSRAARLRELEAQGTELGARFRENKHLVDASAQTVAALQEQIAHLRSAEAELRRLNASHAKQSGRLDLLTAQAAEWQSGGQVRLDEVQHSLQNESYALDARRRLQAIDAELQATGYDTAAHDAARAAELASRRFEAELQALERARAALAPLGREISGLEEQAGQQAAEAQRQSAECRQAAEALAQEQAQAPDLRQAEFNLLRTQELENRLRLEVGAARQNVLVLEDLKKRRKQYETQRQGLSGQVGQFKQLERAFGKDGVPALLIEQALPEIESRANLILGRLSQGLMTVRFVTQSAFKDKKRDDLKETLDIQISDGAGQREYELYSGGEAFRVNFAVRLALAETLAQRAGARLQTLVIDEGFGSQDAQGRQRLVEAINLVRRDFEKILVITHIDELKDAFPTRIEVEKTDAGSQVRVINFQ